MILNSDEQRRRRKQHLWPADATSYLLGVGQVEFGCQVDGLQLDDVLLRSERLGHLPQHIRRDFWHALAVLSHQPQDAGSGHGHLPPGHKKPSDSVLLAAMQKGFKEDPSGVVP